jgi:hypothetical protein
LWLVVAAGEDEVLEPVPALSLSVSVDVCVPESVLLPGPGGKC